MYDGIGLEVVLKAVFGEKLLFEELTKPTLITSYDVYNRQAIVFKNTDLLLGKIPVWEICRSSAAARFSTSTSLLPGESLRTQATS